MFILILEVIAPEMVFGLDFEITDVIEVGPIYSGSMLRPAQWSPDGQWIAYFDGKELMLSDTMGVSHAVAEVELVPTGFHWVGSEEIVVSQRLFISNGESQERLTKVDITTGAQVTLEEYTHRILSPDRHRIRSFAGPFQTVEGNAYYVIQEDGRQRKEMVPLKSGLKPPVQNNHVLRTREDGVYLVQIDAGAATRITRKAYRSGTGAPIKTNSDHSFMMIEGSIVRLSDEQTTVLDTLSVITGLSGCGQLEESFWSYSMNPAYSEVCFILICSDYNENEIIRAGVYDYITHKFDILDDMAGLASCHRPEYSPNGRDLTVISQGQLYIIKRIILEE